MIRSFADELTEKTFHGIHTHAERKAFPSDLKKVIERRLDLLNSAESMESLRKIPTLKTEIVRDVGGKFSIPLYENYRILFRWIEGPEEVEIRG